MKWASCVIGLRCIFDFLLLVLIWKQGQKFGKLSVINQAHIRLAVPEVTGELPGLSLEDTN